MPEHSGLFGLRRTYEPDIIDLDSYWAESLRLRLSGGTPWPPPPIPGLLMSDWTVVEMEAMRENRRKADVIYAHVKSIATEEEMAKLRETIQNAHDYFYNVGGDSPGWRGFNNFKDHDGDGHDGMWHLQQIFGVLS